MVRGSEAATEEDALYDNCQLFVIVVRVKCIMMHSRVLPNFDGDATAVKQKRPFGR